MKGTTLTLVSVLFACMSFVLLCVPTSALALTSKDVTISVLQTFLEQKGLLVFPPTDTKGNFGPLTKKALIAYQKSVGLSAQGLFGPQTKAKIADELSQAPDLPVSTQVTTQQTPPSTHTVSQSDLDTKLQQLSNSFSSKLSGLSTGSGGSVNNVYQMIANSQKIDTLANTTISNPTITGGSWLNGNFSGTFSGTVSTSNLGSLSVTGTASSTFTNGINLTGGCFSVNGTCLSGGSGGIPGGLTSQVQFNSSSAFGGSSNFIWDNVNSRLGIGATTTPFAQLSVHSVGGQPAFVVGSSTATSFIVDKNGNVGVGTATPAAKFDVVTSGGTEMQLVDNLANGSGSRGLKLQALGAYPNIGGPSVAFYDNTGTEMWENGIDYRGGGNTAGSAGAYILAYEYTAAGNSADRVAVKHLGQMSIGLPDAGLSQFTAQLEVRNQVSSTPALILYASTTQINPVFKLQSTDNGSTALLMDTTAPSDAAGVKRILRLSPYSAVDGNGSAIQFSVSGTDGYGPEIGGVRETPGAGGLGALVFLTGGNTPSERMRITNAGNVGIATTSPWRTLSVTGTVGFQGLTAGAGAGTLCLSANFEVTYSAGATCTVSSQRFKHDIITSTEGLEFVNKLRPVNFYYNTDIGVPGEQFGFIAEEVEQLDPRLVVHDAQGLPFSVRYENITAVLAKAIQQLSTKFDGLAVWFADKANGIGDFFASRVHTKELCVSKSDGTEFCMTGDQLAAIAGSNGTSVTSQTSSNPSTDTSIPVITMLGENPATIPVGSTYSDLGATVTDTNADGSVNNNLSLHFYVDGVSTSAVSLDTATTSVHTIVYSAVDSANNWAYATRTVEVMAH